MKYVPELDLISNPLLRKQEKDFLIEFYDFLEKKIDPELRKLEELNY